MATKTLQASLPEGLIDRFEDAARRHSLTSDDALADAVAAWIDREDSRDRMTWEALEAVDAGRVVPHSDVMVMGRKLGRQSEAEWPCLMNLVWTEDAFADLGRLHAFLEPVNAVAAAPVLRILATAPDRLLVHPRLGTRLSHFDPREVRRIIAHGRGIRYQLMGPSIVSLRLWHGREKR